MYIRYHYLTLYSVVNIQCKSDKKIIIWLLRQLANSSSTPKKISFVCNSSAGYIYIELLLLDVIFLYMGESFYNFSFSFVSLP